MKAKLILINWLFSFMAIGMLDMDHSSFWGVLVIFAWFAGSTILLIRAERLGWMKEIVKRYKLDE